MGRYRPRDVVVQERAHVVRAADDLGPDVNLVLGVPLYGQVPGPRERTRVLVSPSRRL
jgi:hypothetical protein